VQNTASIGCEKPPTEKTTPGAKIKGTKKKIKKKKSN